MNRPPLQRGDIVSAWFPFTDLSMQKHRPALVLNENTDRGDVILAFISTHMPSAPTPSSVMVESSDPDFQQTGLKTDSVIRLDKIATIERNLLTRRLGRLPHGKMSLIDQALISALRISLEYP
jgi:mRNA interferase MazF